MFPGSVNQSGTYPDLFNVSEVVPGAQIALSAADMGCKMTYPS
jgi:branched-chain amino acid transport system substrate-binding protein